MNVGGLIKSLCNCFYFCNNNYYLFNVFLNDFVKYLTIFNFEKLNGYFYYKFLKKINDMNFFYVNWFNLKFDERTYFDKNQNAIKL